MKEPLELVLETFQESVCLFTTNIDPLCEDLPKAQSAQVNDM